MYTTQNGWTKKKMVAQIKLKNNGTQAVINADQYDEACAYRTPDGNTCAMGCFIPDEEVKGLVSDAAEQVLHERPELRAFMPLDDDGMSRLQVAHDSWDTSHGDTLHERLTNWINENAVDAV